MKTCFWILEFYAFGAYMVDLESDPSYVLFLCERVLGIANKTVP